MGTGLAVLVVYLTGAWITTGRTYGNLLMGLRVVNFRGARLRLPAALLRAVAYAAFPIGLLWVAVSRENRSLQDVLLRTSVIYDWTQRRPADTVEQQPVRTHAFAPVPRWLRPVVRWAHVELAWPDPAAHRGRVRAQRLFDRAMTPAAQLFTSIFPLLIMAAVFLGREYGDQVADAIDLPESTRGVLDEALETSGGFSSFGVFGAAIVLISATSLARATIRAYGAIWALPRPRRGLRNAWRLLPRWCCWPCSSSCAC